MLASLRLRSWLLLIVGFGALVALTTIFATAATLPGCAACHSSATFVEQTAASAHVDIECVRCHVAPDSGSRFTFASRVIFGMTLRIVPEGGRGVSGVPDARCLECHADVMERVVYSKGLVIDHATCAAISTCDSCHSGTAHGTATRWPRIAEMEACLECHDTRTVSASCELCHDQRTPRERLGVGAWRVTHGEAWASTHGMGDKRTCAACHDDEYCIRCHDLSVPHRRGFMDVHGELARDSNAACLTCHREHFCTDCHGLEMPHTEEFSPVHSKRVQLSGEALCRNCHDESDCVRCHTMHIHPEEVMGFDPVDPDRGR